jgi:hypothetical protein
MVDREEDDVSSLNGVSTTGEMQAWFNRLLSPDLASMLAWLALEEDGIKAVRKAHLELAFESHPNVVRAAADAQAFVGDMADCPYFDLLSEWGKLVDKAYNPDGATRSVGVPIKPSILPHELPDFRWKLGEGFSKGETPTTGRRSGAMVGRGGGRGGRGGGRGGRALARRGTGEEAPDEPEPDPDNESLLAKIQALEARLDGGGGGGGVSATAIEAEIQRRIEQAFDDVNTGKRALVLSATQKQRKAATAWPVSDNMCIFSSELSAAGTDPVNIFKAERGDGAGNDGGLRDLLEWNSLGREGRSKLLLRYPACNLWVQPTEIVAIHKPKYQALGLVGKDDDARKKQLVLLDSLRPLFAGMSHLSDASAKFKSFASNETGDETGWSTEDSILLVQIKEQLEITTQACSDMFHIVSSQISELREERDEYCVSAESGIREAQADVESRQLTESPDRSSTMRPDLAERATALRLRRRQMGIPFDVPGALGRGRGNSWNNGPPGGKPGGRGRGNGGVAGGGKYNTPQQVARAQRRNAKKNEKRDAKRTAAGGAAGAGGTAAASPTKPPAAAKKKKK